MNRFDVEYIPQPTPVPRMADLRKCHCGMTPMEPHLCMDSEGRYKVSCMKTTGGCGNKTHFFIYKHNAIGNWNLSQWMQP